MFVIESCLNDRSTVNRCDQASSKKTTSRTSTNQRQRAKRKPRVLFSQVQNIMLILIDSIYYRPMANMLTLLTICYYS